MRIYLSSLLFCLFLFCGLQAQKKTIAVIGSSTAYGSGATPIDSSWVNLTKSYFKHLGLIDTIYNLGNPSTTSYAGMPNNFIPPPNRSLPDPKHNVTKALSYNPDIVIVNYPSNDIGDDYTMTEFLFNLRTIYNTVIASKKICYVTTTQPRDYFSTTEKQNLKIGRDSILKEFGVYSLNFYDPVVDTGGININPLYNYDGTHVNNAGHQVFFQVVKRKNILSATTPVFSLTSFSAGLQNKTALINWSTINDQASTSFEIQRSNDSLTFQTIHQVNGSGGATAVYSWTDLAPLIGKSFYRLKISFNGTVSYSQTVSLLNIAPPVFSLTSFSAGLQNNSVLVNWSTVNDQPSTDFEVQRSSDSLVFQTIHQVNGSGGATAVYSWTDPAPLTGKSFYRLKILFNTAESFSAIISIINIPPPVFSLTSFSAWLQNSTVPVNWSTVNDQTSTVFEVQRSSDSLVFQTLHQVNGSGSATAVYSWTDPNPLTGKSFYRLKISFNGTVSYSGIISLINIAPVVFSLTSFSAWLQNNTALVNWSTVNDQASTVFEVQTSLDSLVFQTIHQSNGSGSATAVYSWTDPNPLTGKSFYRLKISFNGTVSYSGIISLINIPPPVFSLTSFSSWLQNNSVLVNWSTVNDQSSTVFEVQRSSDSLVFQAMHQENGSGGATAVYSWTDPNPLTGKSFYRLKISFNGTVSYSAIIGLTNIPPPVFSLTSFGALLENNAVFISWTTVNEQASTSFEIQSSSDSLVFQTLQQENGQGGGASFNYSWTDEKPSVGKSFYRLKISFNGTVSYSDIARITNISFPVFPSITFKATMEKKTALLSWTTSDEQASTSFEIQRSNDSLAFQTIHQENGQGGGVSFDYSWTDANPLPGKSFYRLKISTNGMVSYSAIVILVNIEKTFSIGRIYQAGKNSKLVVDLIVKKNQGMILTIINTSGMVIRRQSYNIETPSTNISVNITSLANGVYYLRFVAANGDQEIRPILNF